MNQFLPAILTATAQGVLAASELPIASPGAPDWYIEHISTLAADSGLWLADNATYRSPQEPVDTYALRWRFSPGRTSLSGELYGLIRGQRTPVIFEFRLYWHPGRNEAIVVQISSHGVVGEGVLREAGAGRVELVQEFWRPDGGASRERHDERLAGRSRISRSFTWADGRWQEGRTYEWIRQPAG